MAKGCGGGIFVPVTSCKINSTLEQNDPERSGYFPKDTSCFRARLWWPGALPPPLLGGGRAVLGAAGSSGASWDSLEVTNTRPSCDKETCLQALSSVPCERRSSGARMGTPTLPSAPAGQDEVSEDASGSRSEVGGSGGDGGASLLPVFLDVSCLGSPWSWTCRWVSPHCPLSRPATHSAHRIPRTGTMHPARPRQAGFQSQLTFTAVPPTCRLRGLHAKALAVSEPGYFSSRVN